MTAARDALAELYESAVKNHDPAPVIWQTQIKGLASGEWLEMTQHRDQTAAYSQIVFRNRLEPGREHRVVKYEATEAHTLDADVLNAASEVLP